MIHSTKAQVIFVSEIKSSKVKASDLVARFNMNDSVVVPSRHRSGGLWLMWNDTLQVDVHNANFHIILATVVNNATSQKFGLICIYGDPYHRETTLIWEQVATFVHVNNNLPMLFLSGI
jgi:hypothetical protein